MIDPLTAFSTAGTVLQVVDFGTKILRIAFQYAQNGGTTEVSSLESYVRTLMAANAELKSTLQQTREVTTPGPGRALYLANKQCLSVSNELVQVLQSLKLDKISWWHAAKLAFREHRTKSHLESLKSKLEAARNNLTVCFLVYNESRQSQSDAIREETSQTMNDIKAIVESSHGLDKHIDALSNAMKDVSLIQSAEQLDMKAVLASYGETMREISEMLETKIFSQSDAILALETKLSLLETSIEREARTCRAIIDSLVFPGMNDRKSNIHSAHTNTFQWLYSSGAKKLHVWDNFQDWMCSSRSTPIYWIRGKPGSGKSTLMKQLAAQMVGRSVCGDWADDHETLIVSCFFWIGGTSKQKSLQGLLLSLLYQIFNAYPQVAAKSVTSSRWQHHWHLKSCSLDWSNEELKDALKISVASLEDVALMLLIDGLDEFDGNDEERLALIAMLRNFTNIGNVKMCVSSRPWNIFKDAFVECPQLRLEDLTIDDIRTFVHDSLTENDLFMRKLPQNSSMLADLTADIPQMAQGVFLWVRLVVRDLLRSLRDGCHLSALKRILHNTPRDLDDYFMRMMQQMDPAYRTDAVRILQLKLQDLTYHGTPIEVTDSPPLYLFDLYHLQDDFSSVNFVLNAGSEVVDFAGCEDEVVEEVFDTLERRLASRSMGLLEVFVPYKDKAGYIRSEIVYLHRTVRDFLRSDHAQAVMTSYVKCPFDVVGYWCNILVARAMCLALSCHRNPVYSARECASWLDCFVTWARTAEVRQDEMIALYLAAAPSISLLGDTYCARLKKVFAVSWTCNQVGEETVWPIVLAIQLGWADFIESLPAHELSKSWGEVSLLQIALENVFSHPTDQMLRIVTRILDSGADPNQLCSFSESRGFTLWTHLIGLLPVASHSNIGAVWSTVKMMLNATAATKVQVEPIKIRFKKNSHLSQSLEAWASSEIHVVDLLSTIRPILNLWPTKEILESGDIEELRQLCLQLDPKSIPVLPPQMAEQPSPPNLTESSDQHRLTPSKRRRISSGDAYTKDNDKRWAMLNASSSFTYGSRFGEAVGFKNARGANAILLPRWDSAPQSS